MEVEELEDEGPSSQNHLPGLQQQKVLQQQEEVLQQQEEVLQQQEEVLQQQEEVLQQQEEVLQQQEEVLQQQEEVLQQQEEVLQQQEVLLQQEVLQSSTSEETLCVDQKSVDKLTEGFLSHYLPDLQTSKRALQELTQNQLILLDTLDQEVTKFRECNGVLDLGSLFTEAKVYHNKLVNIRKEMILLHEKTTKLKRRALKLQQQKQKEALEKEQQREKELERERQLTAKPAKRS